MTTRKDIERLFEGMWKREAQKRRRLAKKKPEEPRVLGVLDVVKTSKGTLAVIDSISAEPGYYSLVLPKDSRQKVAWYHRSELQFVGELKNLVKRAGGQ